MPTSGLYLHGDLEAKIPYEPDDGSSPDILRVPSRAVLEAWAGDRDTITEKVTIHDRDGDFTATVYAWVPKGPRYLDVTVFGGGGATRHERWLHLKGLVVAANDVEAVRYAKKKMAARPSIL
jgi:hypothetical protein